MEAMEVELGSAEFWDLLKNNPAQLARVVCQIDLVDLQTTLQHQPALRAWASAAFEAARIAEERMKWEVTKTRARVLHEVKSQTDPKTGKSKTVLVIEAEVDSSQAVGKTMEKYLDAQETKGALRALCIGLEDRKDMLIQISATQRKEHGDYR